MGLLAGYLAILVANLEHSILELGAGFTFAEWSLRDINKPLGVSSYQLEEVVERTMKELEMKKEKCSQNMSVLE